MATLTKAELLTVFKDSLGELGPAIQAEMRRFRAEYMEPIQTEEDLIKYSASLSGVMSVFLVQRTAAALIDVIVANNDAGAA